MTMSRFGLGDLLLCGACTACFTTALSTPPPQPTTTYVVIDKTDAVFGDDLKQVYMSPDGNVGVSGVSGVPSLQYLSR